MKKRVLIVDDNTTNLYMLETLLKGYGLEVTSAENGKDALKKARQNPPDLIVTDILMPVMDGYTLCREWKSDDTLRHIPLVFYTATYTESKDEAFALSLGADRFVLKPQEPDIMMDILKEVLEEKYMARQVVTKPLGEEMEFFRRHNEILFSKLEKKMLDLEIVNQKLRISEECYRLSFGNVSDVIYTMDKDLNIISMSPSVEKILGYNPQNFIGRPFSDLGHILTPESLEQAVADISLVLKGETIPPTVYRFIAKDGAVKYGEFSVSAIVRGGELIGIVSVARDITERKQAEDQIRDILAAYQEEKTRLSELINSITDEVWFADIQKRFTLANPPALKRFGIDPGQVIEVEAFAKSLVVLRPDGSVRPVEEAPPLRALSGEVVMNLEELVQIPTSGEFQYRQVNAAPVRNSSGEIIGAVSVVRDITDRKRADEALRESEELFRKLFVDHTAVKLIINPDTGSLVDANEAAAQYYGWSREQLKAMKITEINTLTPEEVKKEMEKAVANKRTHFEFRHRLSNGSIRDVAVFSSRIKDKGRVLLHSIIHDITDRKQADEALQKSEEKYRGILENMDDAYYEVDLKGNFVFFNDALVSKTGYSRGELTGMNYKQYISPETRQQVLDVFLEVYRTGQPVRRFEYEIIMKDGPKRNLESWVNPIFDENNQPIGFRGMARDITDRKQAEEHLKEALANLKKAFGTTIQVMVSAIEVRDPYTAGHQLRSAELSRAIATEMGLSKEKIEGIRMAGPIHDIGKLSIPAEILSKPTKLSELEFSLIKEHSLKGYEMLKDVESPWPLAEIVYQHHERMNGTGYPRNLKGEDILMEARILAVSDVVESMASHRPYRPALGLNAALEEIENNKGNLYDTDVVDTCLRLFRDKGFQLEGA